MKLPLHPPGGGAFGHKHSQASTFQTFDPGQPAKINIHIEFEIFILNSHA